MVKILAPILLLILMTGCASEMPDPQKQTQWDMQRAMQKSEQNRLFDIYGKGFTRGFLDGWAGTGHTPGDIFRESDDSEGDYAMERGYRNGLSAGMNAKFEYEEKQAETKH